MTDGSGRDGLQVRLLASGCAALLLIACVACGGGLSRSGAAPPPELSAGGMTNQTWENLPLLPMDKAGSSTNVVLQRDGNDDVLRDANGFTSDSGTFLQFSPAAGAPAWAMYTFYCGSHLAKSIRLSPQAGDQGIYLAYSDYATGRWKFAGPFNVPAQPDPPVDITIPVDGIPLSPQGNLHVLVVVFGGGAIATVEQLQIEVHNWADGQMHLGAQDAAQFSLAEIGGRPAIAYVENSGPLRYVRAAVADGSSWEAPVTVLNGVQYDYSWPCLAVIDGRPAIAFHDPGGGNSSSLRFIRALDSTGENWPALPATVASSASDIYFGSEPSLLALNGYTAIAYRGDDSDLTYALSNEDATDPWFTVVLDAPNLGSSDQKLRLAGGKPAICFITKEPGIGKPSILRLATSSSASGINVADWSFQTIDETSNSFGTGWLHFEWINNSYAAVIYPSNAGSYFKYARATSHSGLASWVPLVVGPVEGETGSGLLEDNGHPAIFYRDSANGMGFMRALDPYGTSWATPLIVTSVSTSYWSTAVINGMPAIATTVNTSPSILAYTYRP